MSTYLKMAWRNMWRNWRRTSIALVAIVLGLILLLFFDGLLQGSDQAIYGNAVRLYGGNLQIHAPGFRAKANRLPLYPLDDVDKVLQTARAQPQVVAAAKRINTGGLISSREGSFGVSITAIEPAVEAPISMQATHISAGRYLQDGEGDALLIGKGLADLLKVTAGERVTLLGHSKHETMRQRTMTIVGVYDLGMPELEKRLVFITLAEAQTLYNLQNQATEVAISLQDVSQDSAVMKTLQTALPGYEVDSWMTLHPEIQETVQTKLSFTTFFGLFIIFIACIGILNLQLMAVFERTREMGVLAALGMKGRQVTGLFLLEGTLIGACGALLGCLIGGALIGLFSQVGFDFSSASSLGEYTALMGNRLYPSITVGDAISRGVIVIFIAALASLYPAWQAAQKEPAEALHHV
ncbi:MAG: FtsX-like permease family protein [Caldilineaceae bacterium]